MPARVRPQHPRKRRNECSYRTPALVSYTFICTFSLATHTHTLCSLPFCSPHHSLAGVILYSCWPTSPHSLGSKHTHTCLTGSIANCVPIHHAAYCSGRRLIIAKFVVCVCVILVFYIRYLGSLRYVRASPTAWKRCQKLSFNTTLHWLVVLLCITANHCLLFAFHPVTQWVKNISGRHGHHMT